MRLVGAIVAAAFAFALPAQAQAPSVKSPSEEARLHKTYERYAERCKCAAKRTVKNMSEADITRYNKRRRMNRATTEHWREAYRACT